MRDEGAFATLVRRHVNLVYGAALRRTGNAALAEEIAQEVFTSVAQKAAALAQHATLTGWLFTATRYTAAQKLRAEESRRRREQESYLMNTVNASEAAPEWERLRPVIDDALEGLSAGDREAVLLRFFESQAFAAIGATLRVSEDAARMRVERALEKLRVRLARRGVTSTTVALATALPAVASTTTPAALAGTITSSALAVAAASGAGALAGAGVFMGMTKTGLGVAALAVVVAAGVAVNEVRHGREADAAVRRAAEDNARLRAAQTRATAAAAATGAQLKVTERAASANVAAAEPVSAEETKSAAVEAAAAATGRAFLESHPAVKAAFLRWRAATIDAEWQSFYRERGLTPAQIERFRALKPGSMFRQEISSDGTTDNAMEFSGKPELPPEQVEKELRALLGDEGYRRQLEHEGLHAVRAMTAQVAGSLALTDAPLTPGQAEQLQRVLEAHATERPALHWHRFDWEAATAEARAILSEPQLAALHVLRLAARVEDAHQRKESAVKAAAAP